jgi:hypothetical protein
MADSNSNIAPPPSFKVFSASGRYVGYGFRGLDAYEIYLPGGEDEGYCGSICESNVYFSSEELAGRISERRIYYRDGEYAGRIEGACVLSSDGKTVGRIEGPATDEAAAGAVLLLILNHWLDTEGKPNPVVA